MQTTVDTRWMIRRDLPEVLDIEAQCFECPWMEEDFLCCLRQRNCTGIVALLQDRVTGFMMYEFIKHQIHVLNFAVAPWARRQGIGKQMVSKLIYKLSPQRRHEIILEVRESNLPAQLFFRSQHLAARAVLHGYYEDTDEDAYQMSYELPGYQEMLVAHQPKNRISDFWDILHRQQGVA